MDARTAGKNLRGLRTALRLTQSELGAAAGVTQRMVSFLEAGTLGTSRETWEKIGAALGMPVAVLLDEKEPV